MTPARSLLYVPGDRPAWVAKARRTAADALIVDLEDSVAASDKGAVRDAVRTLVQAHGEGHGEGRAQLWVRIDSAQADDDLEAVAWGPVHTVVVPKAEPELIGWVGARLDDLERRRSLTAGGIGLVGLVETARGLEQLAEITRHDRVRRLSLGEADLAAELGLVPGPEREELAPLRSRLVVASAAAGLERPIGPVHTHVDDVDGLVRSCRLQYRQGFRGRTAIHPTQVGVINAEFSPSQEELEQARTLLRSYDRAAADGVSAFTGPDGQLVDPATVRRAREIVDAADAG